MDAEWQKSFRERMRGFEVQRSPRAGEVSVSIKVRVASGCFHREHSPRAYELIGHHPNKLSHADSEFSFEEHESSPEILVYLAVGAAAISLAKSVIDLITTIIKARSEGIKKGDKPSEPLELIVRRIRNGREFREEIVFRIGHEDQVGKETIGQLLNDALRHLAKTDGKDK